MKLFIDEKGQLCVDHQSDQIDEARIKGMPQKRYNPHRGYFTFKPVLSNFAYLQRNFPRLEWPPEILSIKEQILKDKDHRDKIARGEIDTSDPMLGVPMRRMPKEHQRKALVLGRDLEAFAYFMDQGTGKTKVLLDDAAHNFRNGTIDAILVICPNTCKENWCDVEGDKDEVTKDMAPDIPYDKCAFYSSPLSFQRAAMDKFFKGLDDRSRLKILSIGVESIRHDRIFDVARSYVKARKVLIVVDESTTIKTPGSAQSKSARSLRLDCPIARIMTGTPIIKSPLDAYAQMEFLDPNILGYATYTSFKKRYAIISSHIEGQVIGYQHLEEIQERMKGASFRVLKSECLDLPPKIHMPSRKIQMTDKQRKHYDDMRKHMITWLDQQHHVKAKVIITQILRLQQITSGHLPIIDPDTDEQIGVQKICDSPKIEDCLKTMEENAEGKTIIYCRFKFEIADMMERLAEKGIGAVKFDGSMSTRDQTESRVRFQEDNKIDAIVIQIKSGSRGLTLTEASLCNYLSNSYETEMKVQSEDRPHRDGLTHPVVYNEFVCPGTVDMKILEVLKSNRDLSDAVLDNVGDWRKWI